MKTFTDDARAHAAEASRRALTACPRADLAGAVGTAGTAADTARASPLARPASLPAALPAAQATALRAALVSALAAALLAALLLAGCGGGAADTAAHATPASGQPSAASSPPGRQGPAAVISDRSGPSWTGRLGETVQVDWFDQTSGETHSELVAVLAVRRVADPGGTEAPNEFGDDVGPYEWRYAIKVRLTSLDDAMARSPAAYQFLELSDGVHVVDGVAGLGTRRGPDPARAGKASVGWLTQWTEEGFTPTEVLMPVGAWQARWELR